MLVKGLESGKGLINKEVKNKIVIKVSENEWKVGV